VSIERQEVNGRPASMPRSDFEPCAKDQADLIKVIFDDEEMLLLRAGRSRSLDKVMTEFTEFDGGACGRPYC